MFKLQAEKYNFRMATQFYKHLRYKMLQIYIT